MKNMILALLATLFAIGKRGMVDLVNAFGAATHENGHITRQCDAVLSQCDLLVKTGSDADHVAVTAADTDKPLGFNYSATDAIGDNVGIALLGKGGDTKLAVAAAAIANDAVLIPAADGKVQTLPAAAGTYWVVGRSLGAASADGDSIEVDDCHPYQITIA